MIFPSQRPSLGAAMPLIGWEPARECGKVSGVESDALAVRASITEPERFSVIFERHHRVVWTYLARLAGPDVADEIAGDVFTIAFARRHDFDPDRGQVRSWLYGIASNLLRTRFRSERRARLAFARAATATAAAEPTALIDDAAELAATVLRVRTAMSRLDRDQRELLVLYAWEELSYAEIADVLGIPIGTVRSRLARTRRRLRELMNGSGELFDDPVNEETT
jgi:RNA polymerase sigma factor (sigma-70 family)